jgi:Domain found in Dishevelled, Egl-10, and Pleckstrin (DEP)
MAELLNITTVDDDDEGEDELMSLVDDDGRPMAQPAKDEMLELEDLYLRCSNEYSGVSVRDRRFHLRVYKNCFIGLKLVEWMLENGVTDSVEQAEVLGERMYCAGMIRHVVNESTHFRNDYLFYRFVDAEQCLVHRRRTWRGKQAELARMFGGLGEGNDGGGVDKRLLVQNDARSSKSAAVVASERPIWWLSAVPVSLFASCLGTMGLAG